MFDADWKEEVDDIVSNHSGLAEEAGDPLLDKVIEMIEVTKCVRRLFFKQEW